MKAVTLDRISAFLAEVIGTGLITFAGCSCTLKWDGNAPPHLQVVIGFGMVIFFIVQMFGHISGAHVNPVITVSAFLQGKIDAVNSAYYIVAQFIGGFIGFGLLKVLTPESLFSPTQCSTLVHSEVTATQAVLIEFIATSILVFVFCALIDHRNAAHTETVPLKFGLLVFVLALFAGPFTGGSFNPARTFGPAVWNGTWDNQWVYWVGPLTAGVLTTLAYKAVFWRPEPDADQSEDVPLSTINNEEKASA